MNRSFRADNIRWSPVNSSGSNRFHSRGNHLPLNRPYSAETTDESVHEDLPFGLGVSSPQIFGQKPPPDTSLQRHSSASDGTFTVSPARPNRHTADERGDSVRLQNSYPRNMTNIEPGQRSTTLSSTQSSKSAQSSKEAHRKIARNVDKNGTTSESLNSRRGCRTMFNNCGSNRLFGEEEISEIFLIPDRPPFEVPKVEHPKVLKIHMLDKLRDRKARNAVFSGPEQEDDIPIKIKSDFQPKELKFDQTNEHDVDVAKLKNNLDNVYTKLKELAHCVEFN